MHDLLKNGNHNKGSRFMAIILCIILSFSNFNGVAFATNLMEDTEASIFITEIKAIDNEISNQTLEEGEEENKINFPDTITATVNENKEITTMDIHVKWKLKDGIKFDSSEMRNRDSYTYEMVLPEGYGLEDKVILPKIVVEINSDHFLRTVTVDKVVITLEADKGVFPEDATLKVNKIEDKMDGEKIKEAINHSLGEEENRLEKACSYDIKVIGEDGSELQPDISKGAARIIFKNIDIAADEKKGKNVSIYHVSNNLEAADPIQTQVDSEEKTLEINVEHFSIYTVTVTTYPETSTGNFTSLVIRRGSEYGEVVADLTHSSISETKPILVPGEEYYLCMNAYSPKGSKGYVKVTIGDTSGDEVERDGLTYVNIPGNKYIADDITHDSFDRLMKYVNCDDPVYGCENKLYNMYDGELTYSIKAEKTNGRPIYCAVGFKVDDTYWNNEDILESALHVEMGTIGNDKSLNCTDKMDSDIGVDTSKKKTYTLSTVSTVKASLNTTASPFYVTITNHDNTQILREAGYDITYPEKAVMEAVSFSGTDKNIVANKYYGTISVSDEEVNGDGTITRHVKVRNPLKNAGTMCIGYIYMQFPSSYFKAGQSVGVTTSNIYCLGYGSDEKNQVLLSGKPSYTTNFSFLDENSDQTMIQGIDRTTNTVTGMANIYNWNINRTRDNLIKTSSLINSASILNYSSENTKASKTVKCSYNTTDQQVNISIITMPVGLDEKDELKKSAIVKWTGIDEAGNIKSGQMECDKVRYIGNKGYVILRADKLGIVSFKSAETDMGRIPGGYRSTGWTCNNEYNNNPCGAYGYFTDQTVGNRVKSTFELSNTASDTDSCNISCESMADSSGEPRCYFQNNIALSASGSKVVAGSSIVLNDKVFGTNCITHCGSTEKRGDNCSMIANPVVILKLPKGMSYSALSFRKRVTEYYGHTGTGKSVNDLPLDYNIENISYKNTAGDGLSIYKITFKDRNLVIGYMDGDGNLSNLIMNITLNTDKNMTTKTYDLDDIFNVTAEDQVAAASYITVGNSTPMEDTYNVNGGNPLAGGRLDNADVCGISIQRLSAIMVQNELGISKVDGVALKNEDIMWKTYDESNPNSISFLGLNSESQYRVRVSNPSSAGSDAFKMVVPIPKKGQNLGEMFQDQDNKFDMHLTGVDLPDGYDYKYVKISPMPNNAKMSSLSYVAADENTANAILITADSIKADSINDMIFSYKIDERDNPEITGGERNVWRNFYSYSIEGKQTEERGGFVAAEVAKGAITGTVFYDNNDNGIMDADGETGVKGVTVNAKDSSGRIQSTTTDENGRYSFNQLREDSIELTMTVHYERICRFNKEPLFNIPTGFTGNMVNPSEDRKSATVSLSSVAEDSVVNASLSKICTVTYNRGNGTGETPAASEYFTGKLATVLAAPSAMNKTGYDFIGWSKVSKDAEVPDCQPGDTFVVTGDVTLYALWKPRTVKITFDYQGGKTTSSGYDSKYVTYGSSYNVKDINNKTWPENPTKGTADEGWKFWKWEKPTKPVLGYGEQVKPGSISYCNDDINLRAVYSRLSDRSGELNVGYGEESTEESPFYDFSEAFSIENDAEPTADNKVTYSSSSVLPKGMYFSEDYSKIYGKPEEVTEDPVEVDMTVKARSGLTFTYKLNLQVQTIDLDIKVDTDPKAGTALDVLTKKADINIAAVVTGKLDGIDFNEGNLVTFYGQKEGESRIAIGTGSLDTDGKALCIWHVDKKIDNSIAGTYRITAEVNDISDKYTVKNNTAVNGFVISDAPIITHSIHFDANYSGITDPDDKTVVEGENYGTMPEVVRSGYRFDGWFTDVDAGEKVNEEDMVNLGMTSNIQTLYGHWTEKQYKVSYDVNGGNSGDLEDKTVSYESQGLLPDTEVTRAGYSLNGWKVKGTDYTVTEDAMYSSLVRSDAVSLVVLEAQWTPVTYTVTYDANGGSVSGFTFRAAYESTYGKLLTPSRNGYDFKGWMDKNNEKVTEDTIYKTLGDSTITAKWTPKTGYKVVYNSEGGTHVDDRTGVIWTDAGLDSPRPSKYGYRFAGWKCKGIAVTDDSTYSSFAVADNVLSITLDAQWEPVESNVSFDSNYPSGNLGIAGFEGNNTKKVSYGDFYGKLPESSYTGYKFEGWYTKSEGGTRITQETKVSALENHNLYGHWKINEYKITLPEEQTGFEVNPLSGNTNVNHGDSFSFKVDLSEGYSRTEQYEVKIKTTGAEDDTAEDITEDSGHPGVYTIERVTGPITVIVNGVGDITPPQAVIKTGSNFWNKFLNRITFGTFFNDTEKVEITAQDQVSGVKLSKYYVSDKELGEEELDNLEDSKWTIFGNPEKDYFNESPESKAVVYVYTEDMAGNGGYYSSDGMVFTKKKPSISGVTNKETRIVDGSINAIVTDSYLKEVKVYTGADDKTGVAQAIEEGSQGKVSRVKLSAPDKGSTAYRIYAINQAGNESSWEVTLVKATHDINVDAPEFKDEEYGYEMPEAQTIEITAKGNSDTTISQVALSGENPEDFELNRSDGTVVAKGTTDNSYTLCPKASLPAGTYTARVVVTYNDGNTEEAEVFFKVNQKEAEILWGNTSFTYDGRGPQVKAEVSNLLPGDKCNVTVTMDEDNIPGTYKDKAVATGLSNSNYKLPENNRTTYSIGNGKLSGIFIKAYEGMEDNSSHDGITEISGILDTDMLKYYVSEDGNHWREWTGPEGTPQVKSCGETMIKVVVQRQYYDTFEEVAAAKVQSKPRAVIETPVYYEEASDKITVKGRIVEGDYPIKEKTFKYRRAGDQQWLPINTIGESVDLGGLKEGSIYELELTATDTRGNTVMDYQRLQTASRAQSTIERHGDGNRSISVTLERGNTIVASITGIGKEDLFSFRNLPDGEYNVVFTDGNYKVTTLATVVDSKTEMLKARDADSKQTRVEVKKSAPDIAVYGLNELYETDLYRNNSEAEEKIKSGGNAEIKLISETAVDSAVKANIQKKADEDGREVGLYTDLKGEFVLTTKGGYSTTEEISKVSGLVLVAMPLPAEIQEKDGFRIYRSLNGEVEEMAVLPENQIEAPKEEGYYIRGAYAYIWTKKFSTYAVAYNKMVEKAEVKDEDESNEAAVDKIYDYRNKTIEDLPEYISDERRQDVVNKINSVYNEGVDKIRKADGAEEADTIKRNTQSSINDLKKSAESHCIYHWLILAVLIIYLLMVVFTRKESWKYRAIVLKLEIIAALLLVCYGTCDLDWWFLGGNILIASVCNITKLFLGRGSKAKVKKAALKMKVILDMIILQIL